MRAGNELLRRFASPSQLYKCQSKENMNCIVLLFTCAFEHIAKQTWGKIGASQFFSKPILFFSKSDELNQVDHTLIYSVISLNLQRLLDIKTEGRQEGISIFCNLRPSFLAPYLSPCLILLLCLFKQLFQMIRLHEFITKIRNCKTQAQQRAEYQKQMAAIRESFSKNEQGLRPRNVTKLLFINMSGQETNFGQMECLKLITANSLIQKRIGYLGLTQLFHEKSELLMMATNRIRIDLNGNNNNIVSLTLCVLSEICTSELARDLHQDVLKCINNNSAYIRKKAILTAIKIVKRVPEYIPEFMPKIATCLEEKSHGVLLSCMAFMENAINIDDSLVPQLVELVPKIARAYRLIAQEHHTEYEIGGVQDPFLQVAILKFLRTLRKYSNSFDKQFAEILVICHDSVCSRVSANLKNGANAILFQCFQCFMLLEPSPQLREMVANVLGKFISVKDANSKYLSLFNLNLMTKYDLRIVKTHRNTIFECLNQNDILIRIMALDLLYVIAAPDNSPAIIKDLLTVLLSANDQEFITELALKICLIVEKHSQSRRWHFDTILKVLVLADQAVKEESAKSLVYLIQSTPQLQDYCMVKLFFSSAENPQNDALSSVTLFLVGQLSHILLRQKDVAITEQNILDLIQSIIFKVGVGNDTISYGLSTLLKLYEKFKNKERISKMIRSFETHSDLQVQKRACEYAKLFENAWDNDRKKEICIAVPPFKPTVQTFKNIPVGETDMDVDVRSLKMPGASVVNYDEHIPKNTGTHAGGHEQQENWRQARQQPKIGLPPQRTEPPKSVVEQPKQKSIIDDDDIFNNVISVPQTQPQTQPVQAPVQPPQDSSIFDMGISFQPTPTPQKAPVVSDPFNMLGLDIGGQTQHQPTPTAGGFGGDLLGFGVSTPPQTVAQPPASNLLGGSDLMGFGFNNPPSNPPPAQGGFNFNQSGFNQPPQPPQVPQNNFGFNLLGNTQPQPQPQVAANTGFQPIVNNNPNKILAYDNPQMQIWIDCIKQSQDTTKLFTTYINKTNNTINDVTIQAAVVKHVKLTINPLSSTTLQPFSREVVHQTMTVVNSMVGQKGVVMKLKLTYSIGNQKFSFQQKVANFPAIV